MYSRLVGGRGHEEAEGGEVGRVAHLEQEVVVALVVALGVGGHAAQHVEAAAVFGICNNTHTLLVEGTFEEGQADSMSETHWNGRVRKTNDELVDKTV